MGTLKESFVTAVAPGAPHAEACGERARAPVGVPLLASISMLR